jgi:DNA-binding NarL/FixJ family response regulator
LPGKNGNALLRHEKNPRGLRKSTKENPAQLTNRELEVLQLLIKAFRIRKLLRAFSSLPKR